MVLKVSSVSTNIIFNEYDAAETNGVLTTAHDKAKQAVKLCKFHNCFA
jgi:4-hydroxy-L-threonine phosphate dehydrogenase PdxA